jgi:hypothetical protein
LYDGDEARLLGAAAAATAATAATATGNGLRSSIREEARGTSNSTYSYKFRCLVRNAVVIAKWDLRRKEIQP